MQTQRRSRAEVMANTFIGYWANIFVQIIVYPLFGATFTFSQNIHLGLIFMAVSIVRGYCFRRFFAHGD